MERQLKVPQGRTLGRASESPGMDSLARSWRSFPWLQQLQGSLEHAPTASACSAECCALPAARRSRAVDIVDIFLQRIDGNRKRLEEASGSARASTGCNNRPSGTSGGPCGPAGAIGGVCTHVEGRWTVVPFTGYGSQGGGRGVTPASTRLRPKAMCDSGA